MVPVEVLGLHLDPGSGMVIVLLGDPDARPERVVPIFIGPAEGQAIMSTLAGAVPPRPMTHDLMIDVMAAGRLRLVQVAVTELVEGTFHATLEIEGPDGRVLVSARPSDGIAIALRVGAPVVVAAPVLDEAGVLVERDPDEPFTEDQIDDIVAEFQDFLATARPSDFDSDEADDADEAGMSAEPEEPGPQQSDESGPAD